MSPIRDTQERQNKKKLAKKMIISRFSIVDHKFAEELETRWIWIITTLTDADNVDTNNKQDKKRNEIIIFIGRMKYNW